MPTFDSDRAMSVCGVAGRLTHRTTKPDQRPGTWLHQKWISEARPIQGYGRGAVIRAEIRFDDSCGNGRNSFAVTAEVRRPGGRDIEAGGCMHDEIAAAFPELSHLIRWHLFDANGPMHYLSNTVYVAGDRDYNGKRAGDVAQWAERLQFGDVPVLHKVSKRMRAFLAEIADYDRDRKEFHLIPLAVAHKNQPGTSYSFAPKFQFAGQDPLAWHDCDFDSEDEAQRFAAAVLDHNPRIVRVPTAYSEGKARDLEAARRVACWPDATDADLMAEPDALRAALTARLPALVAAFRADIEAAGFAWSPESFEAEAGR